MSPGEDSSGDGHEPGREATPQDPTLLQQQAEEAEEPELLDGFAEFLRRAFVETARVKAVDWKENVATWIEECVASDGIPMFRTRYAGRAFRGFVLGVCWGAGRKFGGAWFRDVPNEDLELIRSKTGEWRDILAKYRFGMRLELTPEARKRFVESRLPALMRRRDENGHEYPEPQEWTEQTIPAYTDWRGQEWPEYRYYLRMKGEAGATITDAGPLGWKLEVTKPYYTAGEPEVWADEHLPTPEAAKARGDEVLTEAAAAPETNGHDRGPSGEEWGLCADDPGQALYHAEVLSFDAPGYAKHFPDKFPPAAVERMLNELSHVEEDDTVWFETQESRDLARSVLVEHNLFPDLVGPDQTNGHDSDGSNGNGKKKKRKASPRQIAFRKCVSSKMKGRKFPGGREEAQLALKQAGRECKLEVDGAEADGGSNEKKVEKEEYERKREKAQTEARLNGEPAVYGGMRMHPSRVKEFEELDAAIQEKVLEEFRNAPNFQAVRRKIAEVVHYFSNKAPYEVRAQPLGYPVALEALAEMDYYVGAMVEGYFDEVIKEFMREREQRNLGPTASNGNGHSNGPSQAWNQASQSERQSVLERLGKYLWPTGLWQPEAHRYAWSKDEWERLPEWLREGLAKNADRWMMNGNGHSNGNGRNGADKTITRESAAYAVGSESPTEAELDALLDFFAGTKVWSVSEEAKLLGDALGDIRQMGRILRVKGTYNSIGTIGTVVRNPRAVVWLKDYPAEKYGTLDPVTISAREAAEWITMQVRGVGMSEAAKIIDTEHPVLVVETARRTKEIVPSNGQMLGEGGSNGHAPAPTRKAGFWRGKTNGHSLTDLEKRALKVGQEKFNEGFRSFGYEAAQRGAQIEMWEFLTKQGMSTEEADKLAGRLTELASVTDQQVVDAIQYWAAEEFAEVGEWKELAKRMEIVGMKTDAHTVDKMAKEEERHGNAFQEMADRLSSLKEE